MRMARLFVAEAVAPAEEETAEGFAETGTHYDSGMDEKDGWMVGWWKSWDGMGCGGRRSVAVQQTGGNGGLQPDYSMQNEALM